MRANGTEWKKAERHCVEANIVAPANAFVNLAPNKLSFKAGGVTTAVLGTVILPWKLMADASGYIFVWLIGTAEYSHSAYSLNLRVRLREIRAFYWWRTA